MLVTLWSMMSGRTATKLRNPTLWGCRKKKNTYWKVSWWQSRCLFRQAWKGNQRESPEVRIELPIDLDIFAVLESHGQKVCKRNKWVWCGQNKQPRHCTWDKVEWKDPEHKWRLCLCLQAESVILACGEETITEYKYFGDSLIESAIENDTILIFHFVRGDGVKAEYTSGEWK